MRENVDPALWGPAAWKFLDYLAKACDAESAPSYRRFIELLPDVLPCERCREHSAVYIAEHPVDTSDLEGWLKNFQDAVSHRKSQERRSAPPRKPRYFWVGVLIAVVAVLLLIVGLSKLVFAPTESNDSSSS